MIIKGIQSWGDNTSIILIEMQNKMIDSGIALHIYLSFSLRNNHTFVAELASHPISLRDFWDQGQIF